MGNSGQFDYFSCYTLKWNQNISFLWDAVSIFLSVPDWTLQGVYANFSMLFYQSSAKLEFWAVAQRDPILTITVACVSVAEFLLFSSLGMLLKKHWFEGSNCFCSIISTVNTWTSFLLIKEKNILVIVNSHVHAQALATSNGELLWGLADCHHFDSLSSISPEQQWSSYAESIICSQPIYRETAITFYHGWEPSSCFLLNLPFQIPVLD